MATAIQQTRQQSLDDLADLWLKLKQDEACARNERLAVEANIIEVIGSKDEGSTSQKTERYKLTTTGKITRRVDIDRLTELADQIPEAIMARLIRHKAEVDTRELRYIQDNEVELYAVIAQAITAKPAKPSVSVTDLEG